MSQSAVDNINIISTKHNRTAGDSIRRDNLAKVWGGIEINDQKWWKDWLYGKSNIILRESLPVTFILIQNMKTP